MAAGGSGESAPRRSAGRPWHRVPLLGATALVLVLAACSGATDVEGPGETAPSTADTPPDPSTSEADDQSTDEGHETASPGTENRHTPTDPPAAEPPTGPEGIGLPSPEELATARAEVAQLSDRELAGQLVVAAYHGTDSWAAAQLVSDFHLGGVITLGANVPESVQARVPQLTALTSAVQEAVTADGRDWPAFLAIDQEGGPITRVAAPLDHWPAGMALGAARDPELAEQVAHASGEELRALGYTAVFAPVADVTMGPEDPTIGARSPGSDPAIVADTARAQVRGFSAAGILPVTKHFPGHGTIPADSHLGTAQQPADLQVLRERDLVPFQEVIRAGAPAIMPGHIVVQALDATRPATVSPEVITGLLRQDLGFTGLVVTDALNMDAITQTGAHPAVAALQAGVDVLLMPPNPGGTIDAVVFALEDGTLDRDHLEDSAARMVAMLRHQGQVERPGLDTIGDSHALSVQAAAAGITQLTGTCGQPLVGESISIEGGSEAARAALTTAAQVAGLGTGGGDTVVLVGGSDYQAGGGPGGPGTGSGDVVVATDRPYPLADSTAQTALIAAYGSDPATMEALVHVLIGDQTAPGQLPVAVGEFPVGAGCGH